MIGSNTFKFCPAAMNEIVQYYLDNVLLKSKLCTVKAVKEEQGMGVVFVVETEAILDAADKAAMED